MLLFDFPLIHSVLSQTYITCVFPPEIYVHACNKVTANSCGAYVRCNPYSNYIE